MARGNTTKLGGTYAPKVRNPSFGNKVIESGLEFDGYFAPGQKVRTLAAGLTLTVADKFCQVIDPGGAARTIVLPDAADSTSLAFKIINTADAEEALTVNNASGAGIAYIGRGQSATLYCDGTSWIWWRPTKKYPNSGAPASLATAGAGTYTAAHLLSGTIVRDCAGASRADTFSTAALLVAAMPGVRVGDVLEVLVINGSDPTTEIITLTAGTGGSFDANQTAVSRTILGTCSKLVKIVFTNVTASSEAITIYG